MFISVILRVNNPRKLTSDSSLNLASVFRNDWVYYTSNRDKQDQLRRVHINSNKDELVISDIEHHNGISFSPDGERAAIVVKTRRHGLGCGYRGFVNKNHRERISF